MKNVNLIPIRIINICVFAASPLFVFSQQLVNATQKSEGLLPKDMNTILIAIAITLGFVIIILAGVLRTAIRFHFKFKSINANVKIIFTGMLLLGGIIDASAQQLVNKNIHYGFSPLGWFTILIITVEIYLLFSMLKWLKYFTGIDKQEIQDIKPKTKLWDKINAFKPLDKEASIDTGHDYDGIRELDNVTPPWFIAAFVATIIFAGVYLYRYHVAHSAPSQLMEYEVSVKQAEKEKLESLKNQANLIDENTVTLLQEGQFEEGKTIYQNACAVCHGNKGQGLVGPNMTDDYWIHGGSVKNIFATIKYGVLDKGMKPWKDDYSPHQIAQLTSYIKSLKGTNPPDPKAPQGELYKEEVEEQKNLEKDSMRSSTTLKISN